MFLQKLIESSIQLATITPQSRLYRTVPGSQSLTNTYLRLASVLNGTDEPKENYDCSTCLRMLEDIGTAVYFDVVRDDQGVPTGKVYLRSLLWEPATEGLSDELVEALVTMRKATLGSLTIKSAIHTAGKMDFGKAVSGGFNHLHVKDLPTGLMSPLSSLHPSVIEQRISGLKRVRNAYWDLAAIRQEHKCMVADTNIPDYIADKVGALISFITNVSVPEDSHYVYWLTASNPALVEITKFYNTPVGQYLTRQLEGKDVDVALSIMLEQYRGDKYMQTTKTEITEDDEAGLVRADMLLTELGLEQSLPRDIAQRNFVDLPTVLKYEKETVTSNPTGPMAELVTMKKQTTSRVVKVDDMTQTAFEAIMMQAKELSVHIPTNLTALVLLVRQSNREVKSLLRNGSYYQSFGIVNATTSTYTKFTGWANVDAVLDIDGDVALMLGQEVVCKDITLPTPMFPESIVPELHSIRAQLTKYSNATTVTADSDSVLAFRMFLDIWKIRPSFRYVLPEDDGIVYEVTITAK